MAKDKKGFILYADIIHTIEKLPDNKAGELFKHILMYVNDENPISDDLIINLAFEPIKQQLKRDLKKYESICERNRLNGKKGGRPNKPKKPSGLFGNPDKPKKADNDTDNDTDIKYIYNQFYDSELKKSNNNKKYEMFIKMLFGDNEEKRKLTGILKIENQLTFDNFNKILAIKPNDIFISDILLKIENDSKYYKGKKSLYRTLLNWVNLRFVK